MSGQNDWQMERGPFDLPSSGLSLPPEFDIYAPFDLSIFDETPSFEGINDVPQYGLEHVSEVHTVEDPASFQGSHMTDSGYALLPPATEAWNRLRAEHDHLRETLEAKTGSAGSRSLDQQDLRDLNPLVYEQSRLDEADFIDSRKIFSPPVGFDAEEDVGQAVDDQIDQTSAHTDGGNEGMSEQDAQPTSNISAAAGRAIRSAEERKKRRHAGSIGEAGSRGATSVKSTRKQAKRAPHATAATSSSGATPGKAKRPHRRGTQAGSPRPALKDVKGKSSTLHMRAELQQGIIAPNDTAEERNQKRIAHSKKRRGRPRTPEQLIKWADDKKQCEDKACTG